MLHGDQRAVPLGDGLCFVQQGRQICGLHRGAEAEGLHSAADHLRESADRAEAVGALIGAHSLRHRRGPEVDLASGDGDSGS